jgi:dolichol-phosphate mannosyltransferase
MISTDESQPAPELSVVIPVFNEADTLGELAERLSAVLARVELDSFEVVLVDDGSDDGSAAILDAMQERDPHFRAIHLSRNFGHQAALQAGLERARGRAVVLMDADLQDPPEVLERFVAHWRDGYDVVYAIRRQRKESIVLRAAYDVFYRTLRAMSEIDVPLDAGDFCLLDRIVVDALVALPEHNRYLRGLRSWVGFRQIGVEYERASRFAGESKYTLRKLVGLALSGYVGFSAMPLRMAAWCGFGAAAAGFALGLWVLWTKALDIPSPRGWASTLAVILFVGGVQLLVLGVIGEYLRRVFDETRQRPNYVVDPRPAGQRRHRRDPHGASPQDLPRREGARG